MIMSTNFGMPTHVGLGCHKITMQNLREYGTFGQVEVPEPIFEKTFSTEGPKVGPGGAQGRPKAAPRPPQGLFKVEFSPLPCIFKVFI